jgi:hypothetical protein
VPAKLKIELFYLLDLKNKENKFILVEAGGAGFCSIKFVTSRLVKLSTKSLDICNIN